MTDTKHSADLPPLPELRAIRAGHSFPKVYALGYTADMMQEYARAAIAAAAPAGEPVMYCAPNAKGLPEFGKGWMFSPVPQLMATMPLYAAPVPAAAPKAALTDSKMLAMWEIVRESGNFHSMMVATDAAIIAYATAIEAASGPNAALVEALQLLLNCDKNNSFGSRVHAVNKATAALAAAGVTTS